MGSSHHIPCTPSIYFVLIVVCAAIVATAADVQAFFVLSILQYLCMGNVNNDQPDTKKKCERKTEEGCMIFVPPSHSSSVHKSIIYGKSSGKMFEKSRWQRKRGRVCFSAGVICDD